MKRLLVYLIIGLSLGLTFNVNSSEVNFYKIKQGDYIDNPIISISAKNKIALPKGIWQVAKKKYNIWLEKN